MDAIEALVAASLAAAAIPVLIELVGDVLSLIRRPRDLEAGCKG